MNHPNTARLHRLPRHRGFTLVEMLLVIAVISILAAMVIGSFSDSAQTSREIVKNQQHAVLQSALNNWVNGKLGRFAGSNTKATSVADLVAQYNAMTPVQRFASIGDYLDESTKDQFSTSGTGDNARFSSKIMAALGKHFELQPWPSGKYEYPRVIVNDD